MLNNTFCGSICTVMMRDPGLISLQEASIGITRHRTVKFPVAFTQGTSVPAFNGSPPL